MRAPFNTQVLLEVLDAGAKSVAVQASKVRGQHHGALDKRRLGRRGCADMLGKPVARTSHETALCGPEVDAMGAGRPCASPERHDESSGGGQWGRDRAATERIMLSYRIRPLMIQGFLAGLRRTA